MLTSKHNRDNASPTKQSEKQHELGALAPGRTQQEGNTTRTDHADKLSSILLTPTLTSNPQMADTEDIEQELEPQVFDISDKIIITFSPTDRGINVKEDEAALSAIVAHLNRLEG
eukprot:scaffold61686_cov26-Tisochrysis_lutea.AAC.1